jgi:subtilisin family serine protease
MARARGPSLGNASRKLQPKLRMIANCDSEVNAIRAEMTGAVSVPERVAKKVPCQRGSDAVPAETPPRPVKIRHLKEVPDDVFVNVFVETLDRGEIDAPDAKPLSIRGVTFRSRKGNQRVATVPLSRLKDIVEHNEVTQVELGEGVAAPTPVVSTARLKKPPRPEFELSNLHRGGKGVLIGIIDVQGFDFAHEEFLDETGGTRFVRIWDQSGDARPSPHKAGQGPFDYGAEFTREQLDDAIRAAPRLGVRPTDVEAQSQRVAGSHGTHVAGIAAGNHGVCRNAAIAGVLIGLTSDDVDRRRSFYDSTRIVDAVDYLIDVARELGKQEPGAAGPGQPWPVSINISLGTNGHAHDASAASSRWIDAALAVPGRSVCVAAGNAGQEVAEFPGDLGYVMGRIHTSGQIPARGLNKDIELVVVGNGAADLSENELEIWYGAQDRFAVQLRPPGGDWIGPVRPGEFKENEQLPLPHRTFVSIYNELYHPANGANYISIYLSPLLKPPVVGVPAGTWTVRLIGEEVRDGRYHGWIERDDPRRLGRVGEKEAWRFPSFFSEASNVDNSSVSSLACGHRVVSVANLDLARERINKTSSQGPTRDGRCKPDVAAPGTDVVQANGFTDDHPWVQMSGTSMSAPYVTGVVGLMLAIQPKLTAAQINGILQRTGRPLPGASFAWATDAGFGRIDPDACLREARTVNTRSDLTKERR